MTRDAAGTAKGSQSVVVNIGRQFPIYFPDAGAAAERVHLRAEAAKANVPVTR
jgi:hypothetical protein